MTFFNDPELTEITEFDVDSLHLVGSAANGATALIAKGQVLPHSDPFATLRARANDTSLSVTERRRAGMQLLKGTLIAAERLRKVSALTKALGAPMLARPDPGWDTQHEDAMRHLARVGRPQDPPSMRVTPESQSALLDELHARIDRLERAAGGKGN